MLMWSSSKPRSYLVPERERIPAPPRSLFGWLFAIFKFKDREIIKKCGLDAYFFLRYLQTLLVIFVPLAALILPVLLPMNHHGGRGESYALEFGNSTDGGADNISRNVTGLDVLAWGNVRPSKTNRYWGHLICAIVVIIWVCVVFFSEMRIYIKVRQDYLTSAEHRLRASATTILVSAIPSKWLTVEALGGLYDVFPGGIRNIWINRNYQVLLDKVHERDAIFQQLEGAQTELIRIAKRNQKKEAEKAEDAARSAASISKKETKKEKKDKEDRETENAQREARGDAGVTSGDTQKVPHNINDAMDEEEEREREEARQHSEDQSKKKHKVPIVGGGLAAVHKTLRKAVADAADEVVDEFQDGVRDINNTVETTNGFAAVSTPGAPDDDDEYDQWGRYRGRDADTPYGHRDQSHRRSAHSSPVATRHSSSPDTRRKSALHNNVMKHPEDKGRSVDNVAEEQQEEEARNTLDTSGKKFYEFWKPPTGGFASPVPMGYEGEEFPLTTATPDPAKNEKEDKTFFQKLFGGRGTILTEYPPASNPEYREDAQGAVWEKYMKVSERPTHRLAVWGWLPLGWMFVGKKVDTIYHCREELARLNLEIEDDQKHPERFPLMNSAFIQFNHQVAAHMAAQSVSHHIPKIMAPRMTEVSPKDVIWDNMAIKWWEQWLRTALVVVIVFGMVVLWTIPVASSASLAQLGSLANEYKWLAWLNDIPPKVVQAVAGVLPAIVLAILLAVVPIIFNFLAFMAGAKTGVERQQSVQNYYFTFLFVQVFLIVTIAGGLTRILGVAKDITSFPAFLAGELPKASNYFFSYMILQALTTSAGTLLQVVTLILWYLMPKLFDNTARQKWTRNTTLANITWGTYFPVYTNFACIALVYIIVAPIIVIFAIITFTLLWIANRYNMLYVTRFRIDTGGLLYPRAINQTFTGLYFMELCLIGLFFLVRDEDRRVACFPQAIIMIIILVFTVIYQILLNWSFGPLLRHLPITFEDEAVLRDEAFDRAQARRLGIESEDDNVDPAYQRADGAIEMSRLNQAGSQDTRVNGTIEDNDDDRKQTSGLNPLNIVKGAGDFFLDSGKRVGKVAFGLDNGEHTLRKDHKGRRHRDLESQKKIADALYGGYNDELEDLTPDERDTLVKHAFQHEALRARRPVLWIPRDDIGVSDDEVKRTRDFAGKNIWISNVGAALDGKSRVVYGRNPPDFSELDLINL